MKGTAVVVDGLRKNCTGGLLGQGARQLLKDNAARARVLRAHLHAMGRTIHALAPLVKLVVNDVLHLDTFQNMTSDGRLDVVVLTALQANAACA